jgi:hypothetical protein
LSPTKPRPTTSLPNRGSDIASTLKANSEGQFLSPEFHPVFPSPSISGPPQTIKQAPRLHHEIFMNFLFKIYVRKYRIDGAVD